MAKTIKPKRIEFETFRRVTDSYIVDYLTFDKPSCVNFLSYKKYKVTVEEIEESKEVLIERLNKLLETTTGFRNKSYILDEIKKLEKQ